MKRLLPVLMGVAVAGCTVTVTPIKARKAPPRHIQTKHKPSKTSSSLIVDSDWLIRYRKLEQEHGDYRLTDDSTVQAVGGGKFKVTRAMMDHFRDLSQAEDSPTPPPH